MGEISLTTGGFAASQIGPSNQSIVIILFHMSSNIDRCERCGGDLQPCSRTFLLLCEASGWKAAWQAMPSISSKIAYLEGGGKSNVGDG
jgi:hypothetical protein